MRQKKWQIAQVRFRGLRGLCLPKPARPGVDIGHAGRFSRVIDVDGQRRFAVAAPGADVLEAGRDRHIGLALVGSVLAEPCPVLARSLATVRSVTSVRNAPGRHDLQLVLRNGCGRDTEELGPVLR